MSIDGDVGKSFMLFGVSSEISESVWLCMLVWSIVVSFNKTFSLGCTFRLSFISVCNKIGFDVKTMEYKKSKN